MKYHLYYQYRPVYRLNKHSCIDIITAATKQQYVLNMWLIVMQLLIFAVNHPSCILIFAVGREGFLGVGPEEQAFVYKYFLSFLEFSL